LPLLGIAVAINMLKLRKAIPVFCAIFLVVAVLLEFLHVCKKVFPLVTIDLMNKTDLPEVLDIERESFSSPWTEGMFTRELNSTHSYVLPRDKC